jgi:hypothetical protein
MCFTLMPVGALMSFARWNAWTAITLNELWGFFNPTISLKSTWVVNTEVLRSRLHRAHSFALWYRVTQGSTSETMTKHSPQAWDGIYKKKGGYILVWDRSFSIRSTLGSVNVPRVVTPIHPGSGVPVARCCLFHKEKYTIGV